MAILNYTTKVDEHKTVGEIQMLLSRKGAGSISIQYIEGRPEALTFLFSVKGVPIPFKLPCRVDGVREVMLRSVGTSLARRRREKDPAFATQTRRVAWRIIKDWVSAQLALIEAGQAELSEVFLPYVVANNGQTLFEAFTADSARMLGGAGHGLLLSSGRGTS